MLVQCRKCLAKIRAVFGVIGHWHYISSCPASSYQGAGLIQVKNAQKNTAGKASDGPGTAAGIQNGLYICVRDWILRNQLAQRGGVRICENSNGVAGCRCHSLFSVQQPAQGTGQVPQGYSFFYNVVIGLMISARINNTPIVNNRLKTTIVSGNIFAISNGPGSGLPRSFAQPRRIASHRPPRTWPPSSGRSGIRLNTIRAPLSPANSDKSSAPRSARGISCCAAASPAMRPTPTTETGPVGSRSASVTSTLAVSQSLAGSTVIIENVPEIWSPSTPKAAVTGLRWFSTCEDIPIKPTGLVTTVPVLSVIG